MFERKTYIRLYTRHDCSMRVYAVVGRATVDRNLLAVDEKRIS